MIHPKEAIDRASGKKETPPLNRILKKNTASRKRSHGDGIIICYRLIVSMVMDGSKVSYARIKKKAYARAMQSRKP
jgi:hypothetical protein